MYYTLHMNEKPSSRAEGLVTVQLGKDLKQEWVQWCQKRQLVPGAALRSLVERAIADGLELATARDGVRVKVRVAKEPDAGSKVSREMQFTPSENAAVEAVAGAQGFGFQDWVIAAVRAALAQAPSYGQNELEALTASNAMLVRIVADLAALRRGENNPEVTERLRSLEKDLRAHVETVSSAMAKGAKRWRLDL